MRTSSCAAMWTRLAGVCGVIVVVSASGCGATDSSCTELQRTCGCDDRKPCPPDGAADGAGAEASAGAAGAAGNRDGATDAEHSVDATVDSSGAGGRGGAGGAGGSGGGGAGAAGKGGAAGSAGSYDAGSNDARTDTGPGVSDVSKDAVADAVDDLADAAGDSADSPPPFDAHDAGPTCDVTKSPSTESCLIDEVYGVFVSPTGNDTTGDGSRGAPYATITKGIQIAAQTRRVYVCHGASPYTASLQIADGARIFGGFDCVDWTYNTNRRAVLHATTSPALAIHAMSASVLIENMKIEGADTAAIGESSIGALIEESTNVTLRRVKLDAGAGAQGVAGNDGAVGDPGPDVSGPAMLGTGAACPGSFPQQLGGGWAQDSACGSRGGAGGLASQANDGSAGFPGNPRVDVVPPDVDNGGPKGSTGSDGTAGSQGKVGESGLANATNGTFAATGYTPAPVAGSGTNGGVGQGGGGGGASNATGMCIGASGGAGGMGGCGGKSGTGGGGGGASIALLSWMSTVSLETCELTAHQGGQGGKGGNGGSGGQGALGANGGAGFSGDSGVTVGGGGHGGPGGSGGVGGPGAGGNGGPSYAVVFKGTSPVKSLCTLLSGAPATGGLGGTTGSSIAPNGNVGEAAAEFSIQ